MASSSVFVYPMVNVFLKGNCLCEGEIVIVEAIEAVIEIVHSTC